MSAPTGVDATTHPDGTVAKHEETYGASAQCPWCEAAFSDSWIGQLEADTHECGSCGKSSDIEVETTVTYTARPVVTCAELLDAPGVES